ncbi:MAG: bifunctional riboflavin kinase/FMN adenylyltransferase, partial [Erysipelotrichaceae bacterium]|nr:bifunctional riboflavin kinase/FMN adenylyltransferase [Erysipelotrichaceae bacterium]
THIIEQVSDNGEKISSTRICELIEKGNMEEAQRLLGRPYTMKGIVVHGQKKGRKIGFPTANLDVNDTYVLPAKGVYYAIALINDVSYPCMVNFGMNPTFNLQDHISMEAHIIGYNGNLYERSLTVKLYRKLRDEKKFRSVEELVTQLQKDRDCVSAWFDEYTEKN